ncbi:MAG: hypothetical protein HUU21_05555 [Polyangiaceae bacterium]|nr:hypothetical protein [Polyangiaceae bacterium]NUQ73001.1 hypothetical protein [Polyangiaceae bacterium]
MKTNTIATVTSAGGAAFVVAPGSVVCDAFAAAVKNWCKKENRDSRKKGSKTAHLAKRRGKFNDFFYRALAKRDKALAGSITRETGGLFTKVGRGRNSRYLGTIADVAAGGGNPPISKSARASANFMFGVLSTQPGYGMTGAVRAPGVADAARGATVGAFKRSKSVTRGMRRSVYTRWQDGTLPSGQNIELKSPSDGPRKGQIADATKAGNGHKAIVVDCKKCGVKCPKNCK